MGTATAALRSNTNSNNRETTRITEIRDKSIVTLATNTKQKKKKKQQAQQQKPQTQQNVAPVKAPVNMPVKFQPVKNAEEFKRFYEAVAPYIDAIKQEHQNFMTAYFRSEMSLRYYIWVGKQNTTLTPHQLKALRFDVIRELKRLESCSRRYARDIKIAKIAMMQMNEEERSLIAEVLGSFFTTPAFAQTKPQQTQPDQKKSVLDVPELMGMVAEQLNQVATAAGTAQLTVNEKNPKEAATLFDSFINTVSNTIDSLVNTADRTWTSVQESYLAQVALAGLQMAGHAAGAYLGVALAFAGISSAVTAGSIPLAVAGTVIAAVSFGWAILDGIAGGLAAADDVARAVGDRSEGLMSTETRERLDVMNKFIAKVGSILSVPDIVSAENLEELGKTTIPDTPNYLDYIQEIIEYATKSSIGKDIDKDVKDAGQGGKSGSGGSGGGSGGGCGCD